MQTALAALFAWFCICLTLLSPTAHAQSQDQLLRMPQSNAERAAAAIVSLKAGDEIGMPELEAIGVVHAIEATPLLEAQFLKTTDPDLKSKTANILVRLHAPDNRYWDYLVQQATPALDCDAPPYWTLDGKGFIQSAEPSPEFKAWADRHHLTLQQALQLTNWAYPAAILELATTGDPRGLPLLRKALSSRTLLILAEAVGGLAELQDDASLPLIVAACKQAPYGYRGAIGQQMAAFKSPAAQLAMKPCLVDQFGPPPIHPLLP